MAARAPHRTSSLRLLLIVTVAAFVTETAIMLVLPDETIHSRFWLDAILDATMLVGLLLPLLYFCMVRPLQVEILGRLASEAALRAAHDELEMRVAQRTAELTLANEALQREQRRSDAIAIEAQRKADELDAVFSVMADAVFVYDADGTLVRGNPAALAALGADSLEALDAARLERMGEIRGTDGQPIAPVDLPFSRALRGEKLRDRQLVVRDLDGIDRTVLASASPLVARGRVSGAVSVWHDVSEHVRLAAMEERQHLARELHDSLSQTLFSIALGAHAALAASNGSQPKVAEAAEYVLALADAGLTEMRALIFNLRPESLELEGLASALAKQAGALRTRYDLHVHVEAPKEPLLPLESKEAIYRIALEAMRNAARHAHAKRLSLALRCADDRVVLEVSDDGIGFDPSKPYPGHLGLSSMRERAGRVGALAIDSVPGAGTRIRLDVPVGGTIAARRRDDALLDAA